MAWLGKRGWKDWELIDFIVAEDWTFVTNDAVDFRREHGKAAIHAGLIIIVPQLAIGEQQDVFARVLAHIGGRGLVNLVIEVTTESGDLDSREYDLPA